jgi:hypothetical protein
MKRFDLKPRGMNLRHRRWLWLWFALAVGIVVVVWANVPPFHTVEILIAFVASVWAVFYFLHQQHLEEARFFKDLVTEFNRRYDAQNNNLLAILENGSSFEKEQKQAFIDYFNLCAEEYLFYEAGYIYERVWNAWYNGMKQFGRDKRVAELWMREIQTDSYYGFKFPIDSESKVHPPAEAESTRTAAGQ